MHKTELHRNQVIRTLAPAFVALVATATVAHAQSIMNVGALPRDAFSQCTSVSSDGSVAAVMSCVDDFLDGAKAARWTRGGGLQDLGALPQATDMWTTAVAGDGSAIAGFAFLPTADHAFRWTRHGGLQDLGTLPGALYGSEAYGMNRDGSAVCGTSSTSTGDFHAFRWTQGHPMQDLGTLPGGSYSFGLAMNENGNVVCGLSATADSEHAFRWTAAHGMRDMAAVSSDEPSAAYAVSADGDDLAGYSGFFAARWQGNSVHSLGTLPGGTFSVAYSISGDGKVIGGTSDNANGDYVAMIWTASLGMVDLNTYLPGRGVNLSGWTLSTTTAISADGTTLVGAGTFNGQGRGWVVRLPKHGSECHDDRDDDHGGHH